jgi:hypothetical protein
LRRSAAKKPGYPLNRSYPLRGFVRGAGSFPENRRRKRAQIKKKCGGFKTELLRNFSL